MDLKTYLEKKKIDYKTVDSLRISKGTKIDNVVFLENLNKLKTLEIEAVEIDFENIKFPKSLESLKLKSLSITDTKFLEKTDIEILEIRSCHEMTKVYLPKTLKRLTISHLRKINYEIESFPEGIENIEIAYSKIKTIPSIPNSVKVIRVFITYGLILQKMDLSSCTKLTNLRLTYTNVKELILPDKQHNVVLSNLAGLKYLKIPDPIINLVIRNSDIQKLDFSETSKLNFDEEWEFRDTPWYDSIPGVNTVGFKLKNYIFIKKNLKPESAERGSASIMDTGLFDFKN